MGEYADRLKAMQANFDGAREADPGVSNGIYTLQLQDARMAESTSGNLMVVREHYVVEGEFAGKVIVDFLSMTGDFGYRRIVEWVEQMGYIFPKAAEDIEDVVLAIAKDAPQYTARVRKAKDSDLRNVTIIKLLETGIVPGTSKAAAGKPARTIPVSTTVRKPASAAAPSGFTLGQAVSFQGEDGNPVIAKIVVLGTENAEVEDGAGGRWEVPLAELTVVHHAPEMTAEVGSQLRAELLAICVAHQIPDVTDEATEESLIETLKGYEWDVAEVTPEEKALLESIEAPFKQAAPPKPKPVVKPVAKPVSKPVSKPVEKTVVRKSAMTAKKKK